MSQSVGLLTMKASCDGEAVANLRRAGAIPIALTNNPELCLCWQSSNLTGECTSHTGTSGGEV